MTAPCNTHPNHDHVHGPDCGHLAIRHGDHVDYLHDGHLHHPHSVDGVTHYDEHRLEVDAQHPDGCQSKMTRCQEDGHVHGPGCGHAAIPHGDHVDYLVEGRLHHHHGDHCDDHGPVELV